MAEHGLHLLPVVDRALRIVGVFTREEIEEQVEADSKPAGSGPV